jgi:hypothetical protein
MRGPGYYFITICTGCRLFGSIYKGTMRLSPAGELARDAWEDLTWLMPSWCRPPRARFRASATPARRRQHAHKEHARGREGDRGQDMLSGLPQARAGEQKAD